MHKIFAALSGGRFEPTGKELAAELEQGSTVLLDNRSEPEYAQGHIPGARLVPHTDLEPSALGLGKDVPIVCYCRTGQRSEYARSVLEQAGFTNVRNFGGIDRWNGAIEKGHE